MWEWERIVKSSFGVAEILHWNRYRCPHNFLSPSWAYSKFKAKDILQVFLRDFIPNTIMNEFGEWKRHSKFISQLMTRIWNMMTLLYGFFFMHECRSFPVPLKSSKKNIFHVSHDKSDAFSETLWKKCFEVFDGSGACKWARLETFAFNMSSLQ